MRPPGAIDKDEVEFLKSRMLSNLSTDERDKFINEGLWLMPTWARTKEITLLYLKDIGNPIAIIHSDTSGVKFPAHMKNKKVVPDKNILMVGARAMLLVNYVTEENLYNGISGKIVKIVYEKPMGPNERGNPLPKYVILEIPELLTPDEKVWDKENPKWIPVPVRSFECDKKCCCLRTIPLRVLKATSIHKSQGMTVGENHPFQ